MKHHVNKGIEMEPPSWIFEGSEIQLLTDNRLIWVACGNNLGFPTEVRCCVREIAGEIEERLPNSYAFQLICICEVACFTNLSM